MPENGKNAEFPERKRPTLHDSGDCSKPAKT